MTNNQTKYVLIYDASGDMDRIQRFLTKEALDEYLNHNRNSIDIDETEAYEVTPLQIKVQVQTVKAIKNKVFQLSESEKK